MGEQHEPHINPIINPDVCGGWATWTPYKHHNKPRCLWWVSNISQTSGFIMVFIWGLCFSPITNIWVYYGVYMGLVLLTHHKHLGLYGVHVAHPSQTSGFGWATWTPYKHHNKSRCVWWVSNMNPISITNIWVYYGVYMGFVLLTHHKHLGLLWCLYGVHVAHPSQTSGFIMVPRCLWWVSNMNPI
jgi:hypothetical protein